MAGGGAVVLLEDITERKAAEAKISHLARYDELTETAQTASISATRSDGFWRFSRGPISYPPCCFVDLDQFKQVNDTLRASVRRPSCCARWPTGLRAMLRPEDFVARFGATSLWCSSQKTSNRARRRPALPGELSTI